MGGSVTYPLRSVEDERFFVLLGLNRLLLLEESVAHVVVVLAAYFHLLSVFTLRPWD